MRISHLILAAVALIACCFCWWFGYRAGTKESPAKKDKEGQLTLMYHTYRMVEITNWSKVHTAVGMQLLGLTRDYERRFGVPTGTNSFAQRFPQIQASATQFQSQLVPLSAAFTNLPLAPDFKVGVERKP